MIALFFAWLCLQGEPEPVFSGPQPDEGTPGFTVLALNGPFEGEQVDYVARWDGETVLYVFLHEVSRPTARLVRLLDDYGAENRERFRLLLVSLSEDTLSGELTIPRTLKSIQFKNHCGVSVDGAEGPGAWGLNKDMAITAVLARDGAVLANWALASPNETDFEPIRTEIEKAATPKLETLEDLRAELLRQQRQIVALQREVAQLQRQLRGRPRAGGRQHPPGGRPGSGGGSGGDAGGMQGGGRDDARDPGPGPDENGPGLGPDDNGTEGGLAGRRAPQRDAVPSGSQTTAGERD